MTADVERSSRESKDRGVYGGRGQQSVVKESEPPVKEECEFGWGASFQLLGSHYTFLLGTVT